MKIISFKQFLNEAYKVSNLDSELVFQNNHIRVYKINSRVAACKYGAGTRWCITDRNSDYHWNLYYNQTDDNQFYIIVNKDLPRDDKYYRIAVYVKDTKVVYPYNAIEKDEVMDKEDLIEYLKENEIPLDIFKTRSGKANSYFGEV